MQRGGAVARAGEGLRANAGRVAKRVEKQVHLMEGRAVGEKEAGEERQ